MRTWTEPLRVVNVDTSQVYGVQRIVSGETKEEIYSVCGTTWIKLCR